MTTITLPPDIEGLLLEEARKQGTTPELLILEKLREFLVPAQTADRPNQSGTLFEFLSSHIGAVNGSAEGLSENCGRRFAEGLVEKQQQERL